MKNMYFPSTYNKNQDDIIKEDLFLFLKFFFAFLKSSHYFCVVLNNIIILS
jgi:hypothetical protein